MNIFQIVSNLYTNKESNWIINLDESLIQPFVIQRFLAMNDRLRIQVRWLDKYVFCLPPKMYLSLAWSVIPKSDKAPFCKYIKKEKENEEFDFILKMIRHQFKLSDNDYKYIKPRVIEAIKLDMTEWFKYYGIPKKYWKKYYLDYKLIKKGGNVKTKKGLEVWGL